MIRPVARMGSGIGEFDAADWDACAGTANPFVSHAFLSALEDSGSATAATGWQPVPIAIDDPCGRLAGVLPAYAKSHSQGEYVFDHGWADAFQRAGGSYYPKLQIAVPFSPVPGPRLLARDPAIRPQLIAGGRGGDPAARALLRPRDLSSPRKRCRCSRRPDG
jgi:predicted N-acyltransferase